jgi:hypothetical protein
LWKHHLGSVSPVTFPGMSVTSDNILPNNLDGGFFLINECSHCERLTYRVSILFMSGI